ncbi:PRK06851 family protein [Bacillus sp. DTU_2020_1000418_1_SI_GHA_SEK_038]|uniref:PRK06851 family protein n=1 Tax=Bacillus sp. DTU_2020_1000418_1_SI_GHA_SEK_038 TaxID=3077585 RepID=UPI0028E90197|nr:PRK06851 family protein [Bacillus sp. DTU_2020_1000418_1_SI_GHA_SEK_038]WNS75351.1 PRK06851 family protein [Bacillus sp. DTU_2020_1000418_1_SI_GHA_SEK_038]
MAGKILNYYGGGNTARGFYSLFESNLQGLERLFILKGGPGTGKSSLMKAVGSEWAEKGYDLEYIHCSSDNNSIDGVIIPALKVGIVDGTAPHVIEPNTPGAVEEYVNLGEAWDSKALAERKEEITQINERVSRSFEMAYSKLAEALKIHDKWENIYIENMDFAKADQLTNKLLKEFFGNMQLNKASNVKHRFLGAATPIGAVDFVQNLTEGLPKRYFVKGRAGTGKSTMLRKLAAEGEKRGFDLEIYHCGFDPHSLDMLIFRELGLAIFDSTSPHEYFPDRSGDEIIDTYEIIVTPGTDEIFAEQIKEISGQYKAKMKEAISYLAQAKAQREELEKIYISAMDFKIVDRLRNDIRAEILQMSKGK